MPNSSPHATSIASWSLAIARALDDYGLDSIQVFNDAGIDLTAVESPYARFPVECVQRVWRYASEHTDDSFGLQVAKFLSTASFHSLGLGLHTSANLYEMLQRFVRYRCVISHMFFAELIDDGEQLILSSSDERRLKTRITADVLYCYLIALAREIHSAGFSPEKVTLMRSPNGSTQKLTDFFQAPIEFGATGNSLVFSKPVLALPCQFSDPSLCAKLDQITEHYIAEHGLISENMLNVKNEIHKLLAEGEVCINAVASNLHVTVRTLQRRLKAENSSYHELLDKTRHDMALNYLTDASFNITQLAFKLGFSDSRSFSSSFNRWTGQSLSEYRKHLR